MNKLLKYNNFLESLSNNIYYHGSLNKFTKFSDKNDIYLTKNKDFAYRYANTKSIDLGIDKDVILYEVSTKNLDIFNILDDDNRLELYNILDDEIEVIVNNFQFKDIIKKDDLINYLSGFYYSEVDHNYINSEIGDIIIKEEYDGVTSYHIYYVINKTNDYIEVIELTRSTSSGAIVKFKFNKSEFYNSNNYNYELDNSIKDIESSMLYYAMNNNDHILYNKLKESINEYINSDKTTRLKLYIKSIKINMLDNWRFYENDQVHNAIKALGYDGYIAKEKNVDTLCIFKESSYKINIIGEI